MYSNTIKRNIVVTALCIASCYTFWLWSVNPTWGRACVWGTVLGLALLAKTNAVVLFAAFPAICLIDFCIDRQFQGRRLILQMIAGFVMAVYVLHLGYGFEGTCQPLGNYRFFSTTFAGADGTNRFEKTLLHAVPVPLPSAFVEGIDLQRRDFENASGSMKTYFRGEWYDRGWWWYYFYVVAVKVPVGTLVLCALAVFLLRSHARARAFFLFVALPGLLLFGLPCTQTGFGHSLRYILPAAPFALLTAAGMLSMPHLRVRTAMSALLVLTSVASSLQVYPHSLSYFNELAGGPQNGDFHLLDGNVDWGQDLLFIRDWLKKNPDIQPVFTAYWGFLPAAELGIPLILPTIREGNSIPPGTYLVSVNFLRGEYRTNRHEFTALLQLKSQKQVTHAIRLFEVAGQ